ncbi:MAG: hypothetical protein ABFD08_20190 [Syntrophomonas sp.]
MILILGSACAAFAGNLSTVPPSSGFSFRSNSVLMSGLEKIKLILVELYRAFRLFKTHVVMSRCAIVENV